MDVANWLRSLKLQQYIDAFRDNAIDGDVLRDLTDQDLRHLGVSALGHRKKLLDAIRILRTPRDEDRPALAPRRVDSERRQVTVIFVDMVGFTALSRELDPEELHELVDAFFERVDPIIVNHGGYLNKHIGDCVMGVFGAPIAYGNDALRAVHAALEIRDTVSELAEFHGRRLQVHAGVAGGQVIASTTGSASHHEYTVTGESVNLASRLAAAALPDDILISDAVMRTTRGKIDCLDAGFLTVKGFAEPVRAWQLLRCTTEVSAKAGPLVGRQAELQIFTAAAAGCRSSGRGQAFFVRGEAGIGKTRLVEEFQRVAQDHGFDCHTTLVLDFGSGAGRDAIGALVRSLLNISLADTASARCSALELAHAKGLVDQDEVVFLNDLLDLPQPPELRVLVNAMDNQTLRAGRITAVTGLVQRTSLERPVLIVVEDIHWADEMTLAHLAAIAAASARCMTIVAMTSRGEGDPLGSTWREQVAEVPLVTLDLGPLPLEDARALASGLLATSGSFVERCVERAAGNPLFLEQLLAETQQKVGTVEVPGSVQSLMQARLDRLDSDNKTALQTASVLGQRFELGALRHLLGDSSYTPNHLFEHRLLRAHGEAVLFSHVLLRDAAYETLLRSRRHDLHLAAAEWFAANEDAVSRAEHLDRAEDPRAAAAYLSAAQMLVGSYRYETALPLADRGLEIVVARGQRYELAHSRAEILERLGRIREAVAAYDLALASATDDRARCRVQIDRAGARRTIDDMDGAFTDLEQAEGIASQLGLVAELARIHFLRGNLYFPSGNTEACSREHERALELAKKAGSVELEAMAMGGLADVQFVRARMVSAYKLFDRCVRLAQEHGFVGIVAANRPMAATAQYYSGDTSAALDTALLAINEAGKVGHKRGESLAHNAAVLCYRELQQYSKAFDHLGAGLPLVKSLGARRLLAVGLYNRASLLRLTGDMDGALHQVNEALAIARETGMAFAGPRILGELALITDDPEVRASSLAEAEGLLAKGAAVLNQLEFRKSAIEACIKGGNWEAVERHANLLEDYTRSEPLAWAARIIARARERLAERRSEPTRQPPDDGS
ncbi:adenylate/guanylate cyclase domain-containing protein [Rhizobium sp. 007]|uniref:adenylate/guanylate cyclase domain-containing protein n=1 Tax=Rhizobium sp. 007 TaxID=2785056 RepID=UPI00188E7E3F|nr:adenylate/guanylate cyclase domain-containing protein [Rhizobium sp. 007]QPB23377.1 AAA family ATPase [Rhizobium sp. 007]